MSAGEKCAKNDPVMVRLTKIYTRAGDGGETGLADGSRVPKHAARIAAIGEVDEANAALGLARVAVAAWAERHDEELARIQNLLFDTGADLATPDPAQARATRIDADDARWLEERIDEMNARLAPLSSFVLPAGAEAACRLHLARAVVRRAERAVAALADDATEWVNPQLRVFLNRLSDYLFVLARLANHELAGGDVSWQPRAHATRADNE